MHQFFNSTLERELLGQAMVRPEVTDRILADLTVECFGLTEHKIVFNAIKKLRAQGHEADLPAVSNVIKLGGQADQVPASRVAAILDSAVIINEDYHITEIKKLFKARKLHIACMKAVDALEDNTDNLATIADAIKDVLDTSSPRASMLNPEPISALMAKKLGSPRWAVEDILPEGLTIFAGAPKLGKSWLALDIALAVSRGEKVLGGYQASKGEVLYLPLEDSERRMQSRLATIAEEEKTSENNNFYYQTEVAGMMSGGLGALERWLTKHPDCRLVIIDTLQRFIPASDKGANAYQSDYAIASQLQQFALRHGIALLMVHHVRKQKADDVFDEVSGSAGYTGAADATWVLKRARTEAMGSLTVTGRDIDEMNFAAEFDRDTCRWSLLGDERQVTRRKDLVSLQSSFGFKPFTFELAKSPLGLSKAQTKRVVNDLVTGGYVERMTEKVGRAFQFKLTDKFAMTILEGD